MPVEAGSPSLSQVKFLDCFILQFISSASLQLPVSPVRKFIPASRRATSSFLIVKSSLSRCLHSGSQKSWTLLLHYFLDFLNINMVDNFSCLFTHLIFFSHEMFIHFFYLVFEYLFLIKASLAPRKTTYW